MPAVNKMNTPVGIDIHEVEGRYAGVGGFTVGFESFKQDFDPAPYSAVCPTTGALASTGA